LVPIAQAAIKPGVADGAFAILDNIDALNPVIEQLFQPSSAKRRAAKSKPRRRS
jgi:hypothetical protein